MGIVTYSLLIGAIGIAVFLAGIKSGSETQFKGIFVLAGVILAGIGGYGVLTGIIS